MPAMQRICCQGRAFIYDIVIEDLLRTWSSASLWGVLQYSHDHNHVRNTIHYEQTWLLTSVEEQAKEVENRC